MINDNTLEISLFKFFGLRREEARKKRRRRRREMDRGGRNLLGVLNCTTLCSI
jgi:hypothetical protein